jgi:uncharacterized protein YfiM (DUF2279 family)
MSDDWLAVDKAEHAAACSLTVAMAYRALRRVRPRPRLALAVLFGLAAGLAKELLDAAGVRGQGRWRCSLH